MWLLGRVFYCQVQVTQFRFFSSHVAQFGSSPRLCKQEKVTWIPIFSDRFKASFICGNKSDLNRICAFAPAE